jgi:hypothetical protein
LPFYFIFFMIFHLFFCHVLNKQINNYIYIYFSTLL